MKIKTNSIFLKKGITFFLIFFCFIFCFSSDSVFADSSLNVSIDSNSINLDLAPKSSDGTFSKSDNLNISVSLTGPGGYMVGIRADSSTDLVNEDDDTKVFSSISSAVSESDFSSSSNTTYNNKWGYLPSKYNSIVNTNFLPAPSVNGDTIDYNETENVSGSYTISIGARADLETNTGTYDNTFIITAVANLSCSPSATNIREARCMQDVNDNVINSMETGTQYKLYDNRDWKTYYVAKMKDGRVWMTQNLDLDLETSPNNIAELTSENTDLNAFDSQGYTTANGYSCSNTSTSTNCTADGEVITWTPSKATVTTASDYGSNNNTAPASFDYGEVYRYVSTTGTTTSYSTKSACETAHNDGTCPHYHTGNYYNWTSVIASNNSSSITANYTTASNSICPAGWRLPEGRTSTTSTNPGYYSEINYTWVSEGLATNYVTGTGTATYGTSGWTNIRKNPMYMMASGYKNDTSAPSNLGSYGYYWTNTAYSSTTAYAPYIYSSGLYPAYYNSTSSARGRGLSVRCVAKQENTGSTVITFNKNSDDATGTMNNQSINANTFANLTTNNYIRSGYAFNSWNTEPNGSGDNYVDESQYYATVGTSNTNITLYAQWDKVYTVTFSTGSHVAGISFDGTYYTDGQTTQAIDGKTYTIGGDYDTKYGFDSWSITAGTLKNSNAPATTYTVSGDATITLNGKE
ncbi:hypothetical protein IJH72_02560, partial [Candidatus Saccharibacteria bacterium]|nr:hypothetical protein [Candidatus Saccharibacteria bacterium]